MATRYKPHEALSDPWRIPKEPFSESRVSLPLGALYDAAKLLHNHLIHEREKTEIDDEDILAIRRLEAKLKKVYEFDHDQCRRRDRILRCIHPDGCFFGSLPDDVIRRVYEIAKSDPIRGPQGFNLGWDPKLVVTLSDYLDTEVEKMIARGQCY